MKKFILFVMILLVLFAVGCKKQAMDQKASEPVAPVSQPEAASAAPQTEIIPAAPAAPKKAERDIEIGGETVTAVVPEATEANEISANVYTDEVKTIESDGDVTIRYFHPDHITNYELYSVTIPSGATVTWTNADGARTHRVFAKDRSWQSPKLIFQGDSWSKKFDQPGTYLYLDQYYQQRIWHSVTVE